jgi:hypothetical protein
MARLGLFPQGDIYRLREEVIKYLWFNKAYKDSQGLSFPKQPQAVPVMNSYGPIIFYRMRVPNS